jgi:hypothetical protein
VKKGHRQELREFVDLATDVAAERMSEADAFSSSSLTHQMPVALGLCLPVAVELPSALAEAPGAAGVQ